MERYLTFWRRVGAGLFDGLIIWVFSLLIINFANFQNWELQLFWSLVIFVFASLYMIVLTGLVGQTLGKMVMGIIVLDESDEKSFIGIKRAFFRESVPIILQAIGMVISVVYHFVQPASYESLVIIDDIIANASWGWFIAELVTMFFNERRRAVHDFLASSVVIGFKGLKFDEHYAALDEARKPAADTKPTVADNG